MLYEFITVYRDEIIRRCRAKVAVRSVPPSTNAEIDHGVPLFLDQLVDALRLPRSSHSEIVSSAVLHGHDLLLQGFTVSQVVHDYGDVCQSITELAMELQAPISIEDFHTLNRCLDEAIAGALTQYGRDRNQSTLDGQTAREHERLGFLAHELRNLANTALVAFQMLKTGNVGVTGSTGAVLHRSLLGLTTLIGRALAEVRLTQSVQNPETFLVAGFIEELSAAAALDAHAKGVTLIVLSIDDGLTIEGDRQVLGAVMGNLLQNAVKFTQPRTTVTVRVGASAERVLIEVEDECGGLPGGELFRPFEQRSTDRTGLGIGLAFSRWGAEANKGCISTRDIPHKGCVFTLDLPRLHVPVGMTSSAG